jgi:hypothetical protein
MATAIHSTPFDNLATGDLADMIGGLDGEVKALEARLSMAKAELKRRGIATATGERFSVNRSDAQRWTLDTAKVKAEMGEAWFNQRSKIASVTSFRVAALAAPALAA